jgi:NAD(P)-dependent dehydrogenase (short-subunit alcohol dehydrogenase family)
MVNSTPTLGTVLVTDVADGVGYDTARWLATEGWTVILHARTADSGEDAFERLVKAGADLLRLDVAIADFTRLEEVVRMARYVTGTYPRLDLLVNTANIAGAERRILTEDGNERTFQVNYLAPYLLTRLIEGPLGKARMVNVSSTLHRVGSLNWTDINRTHHYTSLAAYAQPMLAMTMFTKSLADNGFSAVSVDPGAPTERCCGCTDRPPSRTTAALTLSRDCARRGSRCSTAPSTKVCCPLRPHRLFRTVGRCRGCGSSASD